MTIKIFCSILILYFTIIINVLMIIFIHFTRKIVPSKGGKVASSNVFLKDPGGYPEVQKLKYWTNSF